MKKQIKKASLSQKKKQWPKFKASLQETKSKINCDFDSELKNYSLQYSSHDLEEVQDLIKSWQKEEGITFFTEKAPQKLKVGRFSLRKSPQGHNKSMDQWHLEIHKKSCTFISKNLHPTSIANVSSWKTTFYLKDFSKK